MAKEVFRYFESPDGMDVLVGRSDVDNDTLTFKGADALDFWMHVSGGSGAHVVIRNPDRLDRLPRDTLRFAARLAVRYSKAKHGKKVSVCVALRKDVEKSRGLPAGKVVLKRHKKVKVDSDLE